MTGRQRRERSGHDRIAKNQQGVWGSLPIEIKMPSALSGVAEQFSEFLPRLKDGEELIAVLPGADLAICTAAAERIRRSIAQCQITRRSTGEILPGITVSIGVGQFQFGEAMADLIDRCDRALYLAKKSGRNRVVSETELNSELVG